MSLLGFDTSTAASAVCLLRDDGESFEVEPPVERLHEPPGHARELMPAVDRVLRDAGVGYEDLSGIAVGIGPGTFTGLRIGLATAHGIAHARGIPLRPVSSLAALAAGIDADRTNGGLTPTGARTGGAGRGGALPLIDARRGELFAAVYRGGEEVEAPFVGPVEEVVARAPRGALAAGDGSIRFREALESAGIHVAPGDSRMHVVRGLHICRLGAAAEPTPPEAVVPCYLRAPDAKPSSRSGG
jgi:tRNA threonylcarbamoyladenosine biosynthesis protein TsaB